MKIKPINKFNIMTKRTIIGIAALLLVFIAAVPADAKKKNKAAPETPKYVFYFIGDGMGFNEAYGAQIYNNQTGFGPEKINFLQFPVVVPITTFSANSLVTDSAAAGTALATGSKTNNSHLGVDANNQPVTSVAQWAKDAGFGAGVATSVGINHATPGAFYAHVESRNSYETIAQQLVESPIDFAAGSVFLNEVKTTGHDSEYLEEMVRKGGIAILRGDQLKTISNQTGRVVCLASDSHHGDDLVCPLDRQPGDTELSDFVTAGIDYLYGKYAQKGFFFMVEGGAIDHSGHNDDAAGDFWEVNDMAAAIDIVLAFYEQHPQETLIVVTADHETGGLILGNSSSKVDSKLLAKQKNSENVIADQFRALFTDKTNKDAARIVSWEEVQNFFKETLGLWDVIAVDEATEASLKASYEKMFVKGENEEIVSLYSVNTKIVSDAIDYADRKAGFTFSFGSHSGSPVGLYVKGAGADQFAKCRDNTDVPKTIAKVAKYK